MMWCTGQGRPNIFGESAMIKIENNLHGSLLEAVIDNLPSAILIIDKDTRVVLANKTAEELAGKSRNFLFGLRGGEALHCTNSQRDPRGCGFDVNCKGCKIRNSVTKTFESKKDVRMQETELELINIGVRSIKIYTRYLVDYDFVLVAIEDVTELKGIEQEKIEKNKILATIESTAAFCHEMNQPLQAISGILDVLLLRLSKNDLQNRELIAEGQEQMRLLGTITSRLMKINSLQKTKYIHDEGILDIIDSSTP